MSQPPDVVGASHQKPHSSKTANTGKTYSSGRVAAKGMHASTTRKPNRLERVMKLAGVGSLSAKAKVQHLWLAFLLLLLTGQLQLRVSCTTILQSGESSHPGSHSEYLCRISAQVAGVTLDGLLSGFDARSALRLDGLRPAASLRVPFLP